MNQNKLKNKKSNRPRKKIIKEYNKIKQIDLISLNYNDLLLKAEKNLKSFFQLKRFSTFQG